MPVVLKKVYRSRTKSEKSSSFPLWWTKRTQMPRSFAPYMYHMIRLSWMVHKVMYCINNNILWHIRRLIRLIYPNKKAKTLPKKTISSNKKPFSLKKNINNTCFFNLFHSKKCSCFVWIFRFMELCTCFLKTSLIYLIAQLSIFRGTKRRFPSHVTRPHNAEWRSVTTTLSMSYSSWQTTSRPLTLNKPVRARMVVRWTTWTVSLPYLLPYCNQLDFCVVDSV